MFSTTFRYGLICLLELASSDRMLQAAAIAARHGLSPHYLAVVLSELRRLGLVQSRKGKNGGYRLLCDPRQLNLLDLYRALAGGGEQVAADPGPRTAGPASDPADSDAADGDGRGSAASSPAPGVDLGSGGAEAWLRRISRRWSEELAATSLADLLE